MAITLQKVPVMNLLKIQCNPKFVSINHVGKLLTDT